MLAALRLQWVGHEKTGMAAFDRNDYSDNNMQAYKPMQTLDEGIAFLQMISFYNSKRIKEHVRHEGLTKMVCRLYQTTLGKKNLPAAGPEGACVLLSDDEGAPEMERPV